MPGRRGSTHLLCGQLHVRRAGGDDEAIAELALLQHGIVSRRQLLEVGIGERSIDHRLGVGRLRRLHSGVYAVGHEANGRCGVALAAVLIAAPSAAVSHSTAVVLRDLGEAPALPVHVTATEARRRRRGIVVHRAVLPPEDVEIVDGIPVTSVARTLLDMSGVGDGGRLRRLVKRAEFEGLVDGDALAEILERYPRRRGRRALARIVEGHVVGAGRTRSELEDRFLAFCADRGLPMPETNVVVELPGGTIEVDCLWRKAGLVVELDGRRAHATEIAFEADRARDRSLIAAGLVPMRVTWAHLHRDPDTLERELRDALDTRPRHGRRFAHTGGG